MKQIFFLFLVVFCVCKRLRECCSLNESWTQSDSVDVVQAAFIPERMVFTTRGKLLPTMIPTRVRPPVIVQLLFFSFVHLHSVHSHALCVLCATNDVCIEALYCGVGDSLTHTHPNDFVCSVSFLPHIRCDPSSPVAALFLVACSNTYFCRCCCLSGIRYGISISYVSGKLL